mmetsp:Transcript_23183/g.20564  ORF Transcript_23183/g.20564 Transcript_23183/m.20564 type:complete len:132 (-) Transcript_23183:13-408(-)
MSLTNGGNTKLKKFYKLQKGKRSTEDLTMHNVLTSSHKNKFRSTYHKCFPFNQNLNNDANGKLPSQRESKNRNFSQENKGISGKTYLETFDTLMDKYRKKPTYQYQTQDNKLSDGKIEGAYSHYFKKRIQQ